MMGLSRSPYRDPATVQFCFLILLICGGGALMSHGLSLKPKEQFESREPKEIQNDQQISEGVLESPPTFEEDEADRGNGKMGEKKNCSQKLIHLKHGTAGIIESPNYPNNYPPNMDCEWTLEAEKGNVIQATFFDVALKSPLLSGPSDSLFVTADGDWGENQRYSGDMNAVTPFTMLSITRRMAFRFKSTPFSTGGKGFRIGYFITHREKPAATEPANGMMAVVCQTSPVDLPNIFPAKPISRQSQEAHIKEQYEAARDLKRTNGNPFLVAMVLDNEHFCSGTLIRQNYVLTSAHCTRGVQNIQMIFGTEDITVDDAGVQKRIESASSIIEHPYYNSETGSHDLSLVKLSQPVIFTRFVKAARLPTASLLGHIFSGYGIQVAGWGSDINNGTIFAQSKRRDMTVAPNAGCRTSIHKNLNGLMMCSKGVKGVGVCQADAGSPMTARCPDHTTTYEPNQSQSQSQASQQINQQVVDVVVETPIDEASYEDYYEDEYEEEEYSEEEEDEYSEESEDSEESEESDDSEESEDSDESEESDDDYAEDDDSSEDDDDSSTDEDDDSEADEDSSSGEEDDDDSSSDDDDDDAYSDDDDDSYSDDDDADEYEPKISKNFLRDDVNTQLANRINQFCPKCARNRPDDYCYFRYHLKAIQRHSIGSSANFTKAAQTTNNSNSKPTKPQKPGGKPKPQKPAGKPRPQKPGGKPRPQKPGGKPRPQKPGGKPRPQKPGGKPRPQKPGGKPRPQKPGGKPRPQKPGGKPRPQKPGGKPKPQKPGGKPRPQKPGGKPKPQKPGGKPRPQKPGGKPRPQKPGGKPQSPGKPRPQKPAGKPKPQKPGGKPRPQKPDTKPRPQKPGSKPRPQKPQSGVSKPRPRSCDGYGSSDVLLGVASFGSCDKGFVFSRITAYLDFLSANIAV